MPNKLEKLKCPLKGGKMMSAAQLLALTRNYSALRAPPLLAPAPEGCSARKRRLHPRCARMESPILAGYTGGYH